VCKASSFATSAAAFNVVTSLEYGHYKSGEMKSKCCFDLISFISREDETSSCIYWSLVPLPLRIPCLIHVPISSLGCWFFGSQFIEFLVDSGI
jgi:hypothetical protein